jgi:cytidylate kinase
MIEINKKIITIDGPAASGKGTVAKLVAEKLDGSYLDSGLFYRQIAYDLSKNHIDYNNEKVVKEFVKSKQDITLIHNTQLLKTSEISSLSSSLAIMPEVRDLVNGSLKKYAAKCSGWLVADGRDMGTKIFPEAEIKIFLTAKPEIRAKRRFNELQQIKQDVIFETVLKELLIRDHRDATRKCSPLKPASNAVVIDSSDLTIHMVVNEIFNYINNF